MKRSLTGFFCFVIPFLIMFLGAFAGSIVFASPPACRQTEASMFISADAVVEAEVVKSRRWTEGSDTVRLVAKYRVLDVFKGDVDKDQVVIVTDYCLDKPVPRELMGYPVVEDYCRGGIGPRLTGVDSRSGKPIMRSADKQSWILFLNKDIRKGAPQLTWLDDSRTAYGGGCSRTRNDIPSDERVQFDRMLRHLESETGAKVNKYFRGK